jgi:bifunctional UDP-N-acetylglucosamine pyrophosphorylase/glucosamine-1-phosphate N-acetyltransferase
MPVTAIVLAAGEGTRMKSRHPKVMHKMLDRPLVGWAVRSVKDAGADRVVVVVGNGADEVRSYLGTIPGVETVEQTERLGTGHATRVALEAAGVSDGTVVVTYGDTPLVRPETIRALVERVERGDQSACLLTMTPPDVSGYGRVVTDADGQVEQIIEDKDCTPEQRATLLECNSGVYAFDGATLAAHIGEVGNDNVQGEYYLTDMPAILKSHGLGVVAQHVDDYAEMLGVNSRIQLAEATRAMQGRINHRLMAEGVTMMDPTQVWVGPDVTVGQDTELLPQTFLMGQTTVGTDCVIGPNSRLTNATVGNNCLVDETIIVDSAIDDDVKCGPRAYLRGGAHFHKGSKAGTHVEIKGSEVGEGSKVPHLSYIGDARLGRDVNIGGGSITCNYDGKHKSHTEIGDHVFVGSDTMMVAPVTIGDYALVGASSCITRDVPAGALALERSKMFVKEGWADEYWARLREED